MLIVGGLAACSGDSESGYDAEEIDANYAAMVGCVTALEGFSDADDAYMSHRSVPALAVDLRAYGIEAAYEVRGRPDYIDVFMGFPSGASPDMSELEAWRSDVLEFCEAEQAKGGEIADWIVETGWTPEGD